MLITHILLHNSQFGTSYRSIIQKSLIQHNLYYHQLPHEELLYDEEDDPEDDPWPCRECCSICSIPSNALSPPCSYIDADDYFNCMSDIHATAPSYDLSEEDFQKLQFPHTPITFHLSPINSSSVSHPLSRVSFNIIDDKIAAKDIASSNITPITLQHTPNNTSSVSRPLSQVTFNIIDDKTDTKHLSSLNTTVVTFNHNPTSFQHIPIT